MKRHIVKIKTIKLINHDVLQIVTEKPPLYSFIPGQTTEISINKTGWKDEKRPFTFTGLPNNDYLEFTIKTYPLNNGVTNQLLQLKKNDELILHEVFGAIVYKGEGVFIAGGAGITPFICIFRYLQSKNEIGDNKLIYANKTKNDIILAREFENMLGENFINILSVEKTDDYIYGQINKGFLNANISGINTNVYLCGPAPMMTEIEKQLAILKIDEKLIIKEEI